MECPRYFSPRFLAHEDAGLRARGGPGATTYTLASVESLPKAINLAHETQRIAGACDLTSSKCPSSQRRRSLAGAAVGVVICSAALCIVCLFLSSVRREQGKSKREEGFCKRAAERDFSLQSRRRCWEGRSDRIGCQDLCLTMGTTRGLRNVRMCFSDLTKQPMSIARLMPSPVHYSIRRPYTAIW